MSKFTLSVFADEISSDFSEQLAAVQRANIRYIEARGIDGVNISDVPCNKAVAYKKMLDDAGVKVSAIGSPLGKISILDDFGPHYDKFQHTLELAEIFDAPYIRMFSFYYPKEDGPEKYRDAVLERWNRFVEGAASSPVTLLHENELNIYADNAARCYDLLSTIHSPKLRATFDPANFVLTPQKVYPDAFELLADYIAYLHIKDAVWEPQSIQPAGRGEGQIREVLCALMARGFDGFCSLEPHLGSFAGLAGIQTLLDVSKLPEGGEGTFLVAYHALVDILEKIGATYC